MPWRHPRTAIVCTLLAAAVPLLACSDDPASPTLVDIRAEILEPDAPASVDVTAATIEEGAAITASHGVLVTWRGDQPIVLGDSKFFHSHPMIAGRSCYVGWHEEEDRLERGCNDDLVLTELAPGAQHEYPVTLLLSGGDTYRLERGTHTVDEPVDWWGGTLDEWQDVQARGPAPTPDGTFTIRLSYTVE